MAITRELKITYAGFEVGAGTTNYLIDGPFRMDKSYETLTISFDVVVTGTSASNFATNCSALEVAYRTPRGDTLVQFSSTDHINLTHSGNTGFDAEPRAVKVGSDFDTGRSRRYACSISMRLPADLSGQSGRLTSSVTLQKTDSNRRRLVITGTYTALSSNSARTQFEAAISAYVSGLLTAFGGTWEGPHDPQESANDTDKILNFSRVYEELIFNQSSGTLDDVHIRRQNLAVTTIVDFPGDAVIQGIPASRFRVVGVEYAAAIDKSQSQELSTIYLTKVKPFMLQQALVQAVATSGAIVSHSPRLDPVENRISASMTVFCTGVFSSIVRSTIRTDEAYATGWELVPVWDGDRATCDEFAGPMPIFRTVTVVLTVIGKPTELYANDYYRDLLLGTVDPLTGDQDLARYGGLENPEKSPDGGTLSKKLLSFQRAPTPYFIGEPGQTQHEVYDDVIVARYRYYVKRPAKETHGGGSSVGDGGGGGGSGATGGGAGATPTFSGLFGAQTGGGSHNPP